MTNVVIQSAVPFSGRRPSPVRVSLYRSYAAMTEISLDVFPCVYGSVPWLVPPDEPESVAFLREHGTPVVFERGESVFFGEKQLVFLIESGLVATVTVARWGFSDRKRFSVPYARSGAACAGCRSTHGRSRTSRRGAFRSGIFSPLSKQSPNSTSACFRTACAKPRTRSRASS